MSSNKYAVFRLSEIKLGLPFSERQVTLTPIGDIFYGLEFADGTIIDPSQIELPDNFPVYTSTTIVNTDGLRHLIKIGNAALYFDKDEEESF